MRGAKHPPPDIKREAGQGQKGDFQQENRADRYSRSTKKTKVVLVSRRQDMDNNLACYARQVAAKEDKSKPQVFFLAFQPRICQPHENSQGYDRDWNQARMKSRLNVQCASYQHGFQRIDHSQQIEPAKQITRKDITGNRLGNLAPSRGAVVYQFH
jgi:hypothetical protein